MNTRGELASCGPAPPHYPEAEKQAGNSQSQKARGNFGPRDGILHQTGSRLPLANHVFLGYWSVDICQDGCNLRSAPQGRHTAHLRQCSCSAPSKPRDWDQRADKTHCTPGTVCLPSTWLPELLGLGKDTKSRPRRVYAFMENLNLSSLDLGSARNLGPPLESSPSEQPGV